MLFRDWFRRPRHIFAIFVAVAALSAGALGLLARLLLDQDKAVERQRQQERLEQSADRAIATMQSALADLELPLEPNAGHAAALPAGIVVVSAGSNGLNVRPLGGLLYYPDDSRIGEPASELDSVFAEAEQAEFARRDLARAAVLYEGFASGGSPAVQADALTRLARVRRQQRDFNAALAAYDRLSRITNVSVRGMPASLIARDGRASVFEEAQRPADLRREAEAFADDLLGGRWRLTQAEFEFRSSQIEAWLGAPLAFDPDKLAVAEAAAWFWENRSSIGRASRRVVRTGNGPVLVAGGATSAAIAGPMYVTSLFQQAIPEQDLHWTISDPEGNAIAGDAPPSRLAAARSSSAAKLPWGFQVFLAPGAGARSVSPQRRLLLWVLAVLALVWLSSAWFILRAISHEMRVARLQSDFIAAVSHEFRSPLSSLCQISEMLALDRMPSEADRRTSYGILSREAERLRRLVEGLLDFGRFEAGAAVYRFELLEIGPFLESLVAEFQERVASGGSSVELSGTAAGVYVRADREALTRAIWNLLDNAVKYSPALRQVWVEVECDQGRVSIAVRDRGLGIPAHEQREIFDRFVRGADPKTLRIKGTGIGLAMVRHIVQAHGGEIALSSRLGEGSRFTMTLNTTVGLT